MPNKFPNMIDEVQVQNAVPLRVIPSEVTPEPIGSRPGRKNLRVVVEVAPALRSRMMAIAFETGMSVTEIMRYSMWKAVMEAEPDRDKFCERVARARRENLRHERGM